MKFSDVPVVHLPVVHLCSDRSVFVDSEAVFGVVLGLVILVDESSAVVPNDWDIQTDYEVMTLGYVVVVNSRYRTDYGRVSDRGMS